MNFKCFSMLCCLTYRTHNFLNEHNIFCKSISANPTKDVKIIFQCIEKVVNMLELMITERDMLSALKFHVSIFKETINNKLGDSLKYNSEIKLS